MMRAHTHVHGQSQMPHIVELYKPQGLAAVNNTQHTRSTKVSSCTMHKIQVFLIKQPSGIYCRHLSFSCVATSHSPPFPFLFGSDLDRVTLTRPSPLGTLVSSS